MNRTHRWEVIAHMPGHDWVIPISVGRRPHRTHLAAVLDARRLNRRHTRANRGRAAAATTTADRAYRSEIRLVWKARRAPATP